MNKPLADTWHSRDLLVLRAVVRVYDQTLEPVDVEEVEEATELSEDDVQRAGVALGRAALVDTNGAWGKHVMEFVSVSAEARRLAGQWPSAESIADRFLAELEDLAAHGPDDVVKSKARKALDALGSLTRDTLVSVAGAAAGVAMQ